MEIVILTRLFPFTKRVDFIEEQIPFFSKEFSKVHIISESREATPSQELPANCFAYRLRRKRFSLCGLLSSALTLFSPTVLRECAFAHKRLGFKSFFGNLKQIFIYLYYSRLYSKTISRMGFNPNTTVFLAHWCDQKAYSLACLKKRGVIRFAASIAHGYDCFIERGYLPFRREILTYLDYVFPVSEAGAKSISKNLVPHCRSSRCKVVPCHLGINGKVKSLNPVKTNATITIMSCSNIVEIKRLDLIIKALSLIENQTIEWFHFGSGCLEGAIKELAHVFLGAMQNISYYFLGQRDNRAVRDFLASRHVDAFINCSDAEGLPFSLMEACSFGVPVIARNVGGNSEIVKDGINGILLPKDIEPADLSNAIKRVLHRGEDYRQKSREVFLEYFDVSKNTDLMIGLLYDLVSSADDSP